MLGVRIFFCLGALVNMYLYIIKAVQLIFDQIETISNRTMIPNVR